jgi:hypothetical protein
MMLFRGMVMFVAVGLASAGTAMGETLSTFDAQLISAFKAGRTVLNFDEISVPEPYYQPLDPDTYSAQGIRITAEADGSQQTFVARLPQMGHFGATESLPNIIGGGTAANSSRWRQTVRFDFPSTMATAIGANTDWTGSNTTLTAYAADGSVIASVSGSEGTFLGVVASGIAYATWTWNFDESIAGFSLDNVTFSVALKPGDINGDGGVDVVDLLYFVDAFGSVFGDPNYDPCCDFSNDGSVDVVDLLTLVENFGT